MGALQLYAGAGTVILKNTNWGAISRGIQAARRMARNCGGTASDELCLLVVLNTASIQLLPTTVASVRAAFGSAAPFDILPAVWISSLASVTVGLLTARLLSRRKGGPA